MLLRQFGVEEGQGKAGTEPGKGHKKEQEKLL